MSVFEVHTAIEKVAAVAAQHAVAVDREGRFPAEALEAFAADTTLRTALGEGFCSAYERLRLRQWATYRSQVSGWERSTGLDG